MNIFNTWIAVEIGLKIIDKVRIELGIDRDDWCFYLEQIDMDDLGYGINGIIKG